MSTIASTDYVRSIEAEYREKTGLQGFADDLIFNEAFTPSSKLYFSCARGAALTGSDGCEYIDLAMGSGSALLGHNPDVASQAIRQCMDDQSHFVGMPHVHAGRLAEMICGLLPHFGGVVFSNSGSEATLRAIRLARAFTGKRMFAMFSGGWHGTHDGVMLGEDYDNADRSKPVSQLLSPGIPDDVRANCLLLPYNDPAAFELIRQYQDELAFVLVEPIQGSNPRDDVRSFLEDLRHVTTECGVLLGFDEIITGFRFGPGGIQQMYGIEADIATFGKTIGGGLPIGITAARGEIIQQVSDGVYMGGTFSGNPLVCRTGMAVLQYMINRQDTIYPHLDAMGSRFRDAINDHCQEKGIPVRMYGLQSMSRLIFTDEPVRNRRERDEKELPQDIQKLFYMRLMNLGIHTPGNRILFVSTAHDASIMETVTKLFIQVLDEFHALSLFNAEPDTRRHVKANDKAL